MLNSIKNRMRSAAEVLIKGSSLPVATRDVPSITKEEVDEAKTFFPLGKFFIYGHARSGTTLVARLIRLHPKIHCNYQAHFFTRKPLLESFVSTEEVRKWLRRNSNRWNRGKDLSPVVLRAASDFIMEREARRVGKGTSDCLVGDKSPSSLLDGEAVRLMYKIYPDAHLIFIVRDGRDTAVSHRFQAFIDTPQKLSKEGLAIRNAFARDPEPFLSGQKSIFTEKSLRRSANGWVRNITETENIARKLLGSQYYHLRFEDLLKDTWNEMSQLWKFLDIKSDIEGLQTSVDLELHNNPDADWQQKKDSDIAEQVLKGKHGSWRTYFTSRDRQIYKQLAGDALISWNYEKDMNW